MTSYEEETDYRNVPRELLDNNIPMGRGMIKWAPFVICTNLIKINRVQTYFIYVLCLNPISIYFY